MKQLWLFMEDRMGEYDLQYAYYDDWRANQEVLIEVVEGVWL